MFRNRKTAGEELAKALCEYLSRQPALIAKNKIMVVGLPRGGVPVALEVARKFGCPVEVIVSKKLPFPGQAEFAIGAVSSEGTVVLDPTLPKTQAWKAYIDEQRQRLLDKTREIEDAFYDAAGRHIQPFQGKTVIVVDDGVATGMTAMAAIETVKKRGAARTIMAAPVMSREAYMQLLAMCNDVVAMSIPEEFLAVGNHYVDFAQTSDEEVISAMRESSRFEGRPQAPFHESGVNQIGV
ncbi:MAG TPA: phosphoribosyltransferase family protein [Candidatus Obscuribacterales bacterium]